jgi:DNA-binding beta-propeller fold protein YncE
MARRAGGLALLALACLWAAPAPAPALAETESCPGAGAGPCPYVAARVIGSRAEGVLRFPEAVALDPQGDVFVADQLGYVIQKFSPAGTLEAEWGSYGAGRSQFGPVGGLASDAAGDIYVVDSSHDRIEKFGPAGNFISEWGHRGSELGAFDFGSSQDYTHPPGGGIAVSGSHVYVADSGNNRVERFNLEGGEATQWGGYGAGPGQFAYPRGIAANESEVLVTDDEQRVQRFSPEGAYEGSVGSLGTGPGQFGFTYGVALDGAGNIYVADDTNHRVVKLGPNMNFERAWGGFGSKPGQLAFPRALASDPAGNTYVADTANDRVEVFDSQGDYLRSIGISARGPGQLTMPRGLAIDPTGRLLVSDADGERVEVYSPGSDVFQEQWTAAGSHQRGLSAPAGIAIDPRGSVYVADPGSGRVLRYWGDGTFLSELGGPSALGGAELSEAGSVAVASASGEVYVADTGHNRILLYGPEGALRASWGASGGDGRAGAGQGDFEHPAAVAVDNFGDAFVADTGNDRIVELSPTGQVLTEWGARGTGDGDFRSPTGIALDAGGNVYVLDGENNRVEVFTAGGRFLEKWGLRGVGPGYFSQPSAIALDCAGDVYVADTDNNRIERFEMAGASGSGCMAPGAWPPPLDVPPLVRMSLTRIGGVLSGRGLALSVSCRRGCRIRASATLMAQGAHSPVETLPSVRELPKGRAGRLELALRGSAARRLAGQLGGRRLMTARVRILAVGPTGLRSTLTRTFRVAR